MSSTFRMSGTVTIGARQIQMNLTRTGAGDEGHDVALAAAVAGTLTTRTDDDQGVITLPTGHGLITGDILAVFWTDGDGVPCVMYGFEATVDGNALTIAPSGSDYVGVAPAATVLPAEATALTIGKKSTSNCNLESDDILAAVVGCDQKAIAVFGAAAEIWQVQIPVALSPVTWDAQSGSACPVDADTTTLVAYNGGVVAATLSYGFLLET